MTTLYQVLEQHAYVYHVVEKVHLSNCIKQGVKIPRVLASISGALKKEKNFPVVGDWVHIKGSEGRLVIQEIVPRENSVCRIHPRKKTPQILAANISKGFVVHGLDQDFHPELLVRAFACALQGGAELVFIVNKMDLKEIHSERYQEIITFLSLFPEVETHFIDTTEKEFGLEKLKQKLNKNNSVLFIGASGAGKSSIINKLAQQNIMKIGEVNPGDKKGRHTTTTRVLHYLNGFALVDIPGIRDVVPYGDIINLTPLFPEFFNEAKNCKYTDCIHLHEEHCALREKFLSSDNEKLQLKLKYWQNLMNILNEYNDQNSYSKRRY